MAFRFDVVFWELPFRANSKVSDLALTKACTASSNDQLLRNLFSCSVARQSGHLPSFDSALRMQSEQNVWEQFVIIGVL